MLIVSSLSGAKEAFDRLRPARVVSLLSDEDAAPAFEGALHLKLCVEREACAQDIDDAARRRARELVRFITDWDGRGDILVHCSRGVSRSTAAAFIIQCMKSPDRPEGELARALRAAAPYADPCPLLITYADEALGRAGRMIEAIESLSAPSTVICAPTLALPLAP